MRTVTFDSGNSQSDTNQRITARLDCHLFIIKYSICQVICRIDHQSKSKSSGLAGELYQSGIKEGAENRSRFSTYREQRDSETDYEVVKRGCARLDRELTAVSRSFRCGRGLGRRRLRGICFIFAENNLSWDFARAAAFLTHQPKQIQMPN